MTPFRLPEDFESWVTQVRQHNVNHLTLSQIRDAKSFSGSTIPPKAFLQLRAVWPPTQTYDKAVDALRRDGFISKDNGNRATSDPERKIPLAGRSYPAAECCLRALLGQVAPAKSGRGPNTTPIAQSTYLPKSELLEAEGNLGIFVSSLSLWRQTRPVPNAHVDACTQEGHKSEEDGYDDSSSESYDLSCAERSELSHCEAEMRLLMGDSPSKPPKDFEFAVPSGKKTLTVDSSEIEHEPLSWNFEGRLKVNYKRTPYEVQTTVFFVAFFHALFAYRLSIPWSRFVRVAAEERRYNFGPSLFTACPDGAFYAPPISTTPFLTFEFKPDRRSVHRDKICSEETAEMAAILSQELAASRKAQSKLSEEESYDRLTISLNRDEYYITIVSYNNRYLRYINDSHSITYSDTLSAQDMITFQSYGPFRFNDRHVMYDFCSLLTAVVTKKMGESNDEAASLIDSLTTQDARQAYN